MKQAQKYIHLQYYIIRNDELWQEIEKVLIQKAREGVQVRVLFDSMGCRTMHNKDWKRLEAEGIMVAEFFPALLGKASASRKLQKSQKDSGNRRKNRLCRRGLTWAGSTLAGIKSSVTGGIHICVSKEPPSHHWRSDLCWTGIMPQKKICFWKIHCLSFLCICGREETRCRLFPADRTPRLRRSMTITCV